MAFDDDGDSGRVLVLVVAYNAKRHVRSVFERIPPDLFNNRSPDVSLHIRKLRHIIFTSLYRMTAQPTARTVIVGVEAVHAIVVPKDGHALEPDEIIAHCHELVAGYKCPRSVEIRSEPFPLSGAGKILKRDLRAPYWEGHETGVA